MAAIISDDAIEHRAIAIAPSRYRHRAIALSSSRHRAIVIASSRHRAIAPSRYRAIAPSLHRAIAPSRHRHRAIAPSRHRHRAIASSSSRHRTIAPSTYKSMVRWRDSEVHGPIRIPYITLTPGWSKLYFLFYVYNDLWSFGYKNLISDPEPNIVKERNVKP